MWKCNNAKADIGPEPKPVLFKTGKPRVVDLQRRDIIEVPCTESIFDRLNPRTMHILKRLPYGLGHPEDDRGPSGKKPQEVTLVKTRANRNHAYRGAPPFDGDH